MSHHAQDVARVLAHRKDNGGDFWASADGRIYVGNPYSTIGALGILHELDVEAGHEAVRGGIELLLAAARPDGRIRVAPKAPMYPCYTAEAARMLCRFGYETDESVERTVSYLIDNVHPSGGWRCSFSRFGKGPETECGSPGATLYGLDVLRFFPEFRSRSEWLDGAIELLLGHWQTKLPLGPCHHGIGSLFGQVEFPFIRYNLFYYVYVLSFFDRAKEDERFRQAASVLESKLDAEGELVVERPHRGLKELDFCRKGQPSALATRRYREIRQRLAS